MDRDVAQPWRSRVAPPRPRRCDAGAGAVILLVMAQVAVLGSCSPGRRPGPPDGGSDGGGPGPHLGACRSATTCDPLDRGLVRTCDPDGPGMPLYQCGADLTCSMGRCISPSCATIEKQASISGCLFYTAELDNVDSDDLQPSLIVVTNTSQSPASISLEVRVPGQDWAAVQSMTIPGGRAGSFTIANQHVEGGGIGAALARRVISDAPVTVMLLESADLDETSTSSAGTLVLPVHALGTHYMAMSYRQQTTPEIDELPGGRGGAAEAAIVATQDQTMFRIWPPGVPLTADPQVIGLERDGDVYQLVSQNDGDDLTGTTIIGDKPFALFSGNVTTTYGKSSVGIHSPDMAMEQMMPVGAWSKSYVAVRLPAQSETCDSTLGGSSFGFWRFLAAQTTVLHFSSRTPIDDLAVTAGIVYELPVPSADDFVVRADAPFLATQGMDCEATLSSAIPADAAGTLVQLFALPPNFDHVLALVRRNDSDFAGPVILDREDITNQFVPLDDVFEVARIEIPSCFGPIDRCVHRLTGAFGISLRGMDVVCGYAVTFPTWVQCVGDGCY